ncbi:MAG TPA: DUF2892 domain-containing protein [Lachnospiraceae bacterium]|nr:DUF2892 domain-containing protein [Lachnospiraceae bacterium]
MKKCIFPPTMKRVSESTKPFINASIRDKTIQTLKMYKGSTKELIDERIKTLDYEWDTERCLETNASLIVLISSVLGLKTSRCWFLLTGTVGFFLLWHALFGWCPPLPFLREAGVRTSEEIHCEKTVLKVFQGEFNNTNIDIDELYLRAEK